MKYIVIFLANKGRDIPPPPVVLSGGGGGPDPHRLPTGGNPVSQLSLIPI